MNRLLDRLRPYRVAVRVGGVGGVLVVWALAFQWGWAKSEWSSPWSRAAPLGGTPIGLTPRSIETTAEREKRETVKNKELRDSYQTLKQGVLGDTRKTRGDDPDPLLPRPQREGDDFTPTQKCQYMKAMDPVKYGAYRCWDEDGDGY